MTHLVYFRLLTSFWQIFPESVTYLCYVEILNRIGHLNHDTLSDNDNLRIPGYELIRVDHPSNQKRGGICIYHKNFKV